MAKQTASRRYFHVALADQFRYYLAPDFFLMGMTKTEMHLQIYYPGLYKFNAYYVKQQ